MNEYSHDPVRVDNLSEPDKITLANAVNQYYTILKLSKDNPTFEDVVRLYMEKTDPKKADKNYHKLYRGWQLANLPALNVNEYSIVYGNVFNNLEDADNILNSIVERHPDDNLEIKTNEDSKGTSEKKERSLLKIRKERRVQNYWYLGLSVLVGIILGWYLKLPNNELIIKLAECDSLWRKNLVLDFYKNKSTFFSTEFFSFNWTVFLLGTLICFLLLLFFNDRKFRRYLHQKITFREDKKSKLQNVYLDSVLDYFNQFYQKLVLAFRKILSTLRYIFHILRLILLSIIALIAFFSAFVSLFEESYFTFIYVLFISFVFLVLFYVYYKDYRETWH